MSCLLKDLVEMLSAQETSHLIIIRIQAIIEV